MNCLEFRRQLAVDPGARSVVFLEHREACAACAEATVRADGFESSLRRALAVPVPEGLAERILLAQTTAQRQGRQGSNRRWFAIAAAAVLTLLSGAIGYRVLLKPSLAEISVAHIPHEPQALTARALVAESDVQAAFARYQVRLASEPQPVNYVHNCPVADSHAVHMVVQRVEGPVTVMYYADRHERKRADFQRDGLMGRSVPMAQGTLVLLSANDRSFDALELAWRGSIEGPGPGDLIGAAGGL